MAHRTRGAGARRARRPAGDERERRAKSVTQSFYTENPYAKPIPEGRGRGVSSVTSISTQPNETAGTDATRDEDRTSAAAESGESAGRHGSDDRGGPHGPAASDDAAHDGVADRNATVRVRLVESTVVAAITGVFVVLSGSTQAAPRLSLPVALTGVLWLFVRTLSPMKRRSGGEARTVDDGAASRAEDGAATVTAAESVPDSSPDEAPVSTDRRLKLEVADHGGRMMQKDLVEAIDLSESAVSRRLSRLEREDDEVGRVCLGRENMVYLEGHRPDGADSPFDGDAEDGG